MIYAIIVGTTIKLIFFYFSESCGNKTTPISLYHNFLISLLITIIYHLPMSFFFNIIRKFERSLGLDSFKRKCADIFVMQWNNTDLTINQWV